MALGMSFSGGGIRGASHLGIYQALSEKGINPTIYTGCSAGSIVATLLALGFTPEEALDKFKEANDGLLDISYWQLTKGVFTKFDGITGVAKGKKLEKILNNIFEGKTILDVKKKLAIVTTDILTGQQVIFSDSPMYDKSLIKDDSHVLISPAKDIPLSLIVSASCSIPAIFTPKKYQDYYLVDGGIVNNLPSDVAYALGSKEVASIDLGYSGQQRQVEGMFGIVSQSIQIMMERIVDNNDGSYGIYLNPKIYDVGVLDTSQVEACFYRGYQYGKSVADEVIAQLEGVSK